jgi:molecular chaperone HtpG
MSAQPQTMGFETEVSKVLQLFANSLYSDREIFLRELISNASDAADKLRYGALTEPSLYGDDADLKIWISVDADQRRLMIRDNGIGMTREEAIAHLGTIAKSGTEQFKTLLGNDQAKDSQLIGQFGVGFYSVFIVADQVSVRSRSARSAASEGVLWSSQGQGEFTVETIEQAARGTEITLHLKEDALDFLEPTRLRTIIKKYSDHIMLPVVMDKLPEPAMSSEAEEADQADETVIEVPEEEVVNSAQALWTLSKNEITDEEYEALYQHISHDFEKPLAWSHNKVEGNQEYTSLLYVPSRAPFDLWMREQTRGLKLYVKRVFIMDDAEHFLPLYLRFVKGVIDSSDLPLNISREILQSNRLVERMKSGSVKRILSLLEKMAKNKPEQYADFWKTFGEVFKEGVSEDAANQDRIMPLLRFASTHDSEMQSVALADYVERMGADQKAIYYLTADNLVAAKSSPLLEVFKQKNIEVLLLTDRVDEWVVNSVNDFMDNPLTSISKGDLNLDGSADKSEESQEAEAPAENEHADFLARCQTALTGKVSAVRMSQRLVDSPSCVVADQQGMTGHMQRILASAGQTVPKTPPVLELNPEHAMVKKMQAMDAESGLLDRWVFVLFQQALLCEGEVLENPAAFVKELNELLMQ